MAKKREPGLLEGLVGPTKSREVDENRVGLIETLDRSPMYLICQGMLGPQGSNPTSDKTTRKHRPGFTLSRETVRENKRPTTMAPPKIPLAIAGYGCSRAIPVIDPWWFDRQSRLARPAPEARQRHDQQT
ncbi:hypothetical protein FZEAL_8580 [Fusarium zealandicum]|uniref:Uncharacterized protein n=1 Tax=Fusarium zealandicum TaxID=1053134 RepID=A0A8H4UEJ4_9HYPO|nr:hypothetical protein FZEAL_8580 [Fusarium zealandicum]